MQVPLSSGIVLENQYLMAWGSTLRWVSGIVRLAGAVRMMASVGMARRPVCSHERAVVRESFVSHTGHRVTLFLPYLSICIFFLWCNKISNHLLSISCFTVETWDGVSDPVVYHGRTLTSKILFSEVIEAINKHAFHTSP